MLSMVRIRNYHGSEIVLSGLSRIQLIGEGRTEGLLESLSFPPPEMEIETETDLPPTSLLVPMQVTPLLPYQTRVSVLKSAFNRSREGDTVLASHLDWHLHHSELKELVEVIHHNITQRDMQLIATTNSYELISELHYRLNTPELTFIRMKHLKEESRWEVVHYPSEVLHAALERGWEIR
jgi:hypothetical protein